MAGDRQIINFETVASIADDLNFAAQLSAGGRNKRVPYLQFKTDIFASAESISAIDARVNAHIGNTIAGLDGGDVVTQLTVKFEQANNRHLIFTSMDNDVTISGALVHQAERDVANGFVGLGANSKAFIAGNSGIGTTTDTLNGAAYRFRVVRPTDASINIHSDTTASGFSVIEFTNNVYNSTTARSNARWQFGLATTAGATADRFFVGRAGISSADFAIDKDGNASFIGTVRLDKKDILFVNPTTDFNHGLGWYGSGKPFAGANIDGPVLFGYNGGALGTTNGGQVIALQWGLAGAVSMPGKLSVGGYMAVQTANVASFSNIQGPAVGGPGGGALVQTSGNTVVVRWNASGQVYFGNQINVAGIASYAVITSAPGLDNNRWSIWENAGVLTYRKKDSGGTVTDTVIGGGGSPSYLSSTFLNLGSTLDSTQKSFLSTGASSTIAVYNTAATTGYQLFAWHHKADGSYILQRYNDAATAWQEDVINFYRFSATQTDCALNGSISADYFSAYTGFTGKRIILSGAGDQCYVGLRNLDAAAGYAQWAMNTNADGSLDISAYDDSFSNGVYGIRIERTGVAAGAPTITAVRRAGGGASFDTTSDLNTKIRESIKEINAKKSLDIITSIPVVNFQHTQEFSERNQFDKDKIYIGTIAQWIKGKCDEAIVDGKELSINYDPLIWHAINSIKAIKEELDALKKKH